MRINKIYDGFMGECNPHGIGAKCTFIRLSGCNVRCYEKMGFLCDTPEALKMTGGVVLSAKNVVESYSHQDLVCITGGEPLVHPDCDELIQRLVANGKKVVLETNGTIPLKCMRSDLFKAKYYADDFSIIMDYKSKSAGVKSIRENIEWLTSLDYIKFVLYDEADYQEMLEVVSTTATMAKWSVGLFWGGKLKYQWLVKKLLVTEYNIQINMQTHKMMVLYDKSDGVENLKIPKTL